MIVLNVDKIKGNKEKLSIEDIIFENNEIFTNEKNINFPHTDININEGKLTISNNKKNIIIGNNIIKCQKKNDPTNKEKLIIQPNGKTILGICDIKKIESDLNIKSGIINSEKNTPLKLNLNGNVKINPTENIPQYILGINNNLEIVKLGINEDKIISKEPITTLFKLNKINVYKYTDKENNTYNYIDKKYSIVDIIMSLICEVKKLNGKKNDQYNPSAIDNILKEIDNIYSHINGHESILDLRNNENDETAKLIKKLSGRIDVLEKKIELLRSVKKKKKKTFNIF